MRLTAKREKFSQNIANGMNQYKSHLDAFPSSQKWKRATVDRQANELMKNPKIIARINELQEPLRKKFEVTRESLVEEIIAAQKMGVIKKNGNAFLKAIELKAKITGNMIEKQEVKHSGDVNLYVNGVKKL